MWKILSYLAKTSYLDNPGHYAGRIGNRLFVAGGEPEEYYCASDISHGVSNNGQPSD